MAVHDHIVVRGFRFSRILKARSQLLGEHSNAWLAEYPFMIPRNLKGFSAASEQFTPPEIGITCRKDWPILASENDSRARQWFWFGKNRIEVKEILRVNSAQLANAKLEI